MTMSAFITGGLNIEYKSMLNLYQTTEYEGRIPLFYFSKYRAGPLLD